MKAENIELMKLKESCDRFALYDDLKELHQKTLPPLAIVQNQMQTFSNEHQQMREMIRKYDENFNIKANKVDILDLREKKLDKELLDPPIKALGNRIFDANEEIKRVKQLIELLQENMSTQIYEGVKKANAQIIKAQEKLQEKQRKAAMEEMKARTSSMRGKGSQDGSGLSRRSPFGRQSTMRVMVGQPQPKEATEPAAD